MIATVSRELGKLDPAKFLENFISYLILDKNLLKIHFFENQSSRFKLTFCLEPALEMKNCKSDPRSYRFTNFEFLSLTHKNFQKTNFYTSLKMDYVMWRLQWLQ